MKQKRCLCFGLLLLLILFITAACQASGGERVENMPPATLPRDPLVGVELGEVEREKGQTTVTLYRRLGSNKPTKIKTLLCEGETYTLCTDYKAMEAYWGMEESQYAYIGWFHMDEEGEPGSHAGDVEVQLEAGKDLPLIAVFNTRGSHNASITTIRLYSKVGNKKADFREIYVELDEYQLPENMTDWMKEWKLDEKRYTFQGWYYADPKGEPRKEAENRRVVPEPGIAAHLTAVFVDNQTGETANIPKE